MKRISYSYIHGFASSGNSTKGRAIQEMIPHILLPTLYTDFDRYTVSDALRAMNEMHETERKRRGGGDLKWRFVGSSLGGYLSSKWAEQNPDCVDRMVLYCPALDLPTLLKDNFSASDLEKWKQEGELKIDGPEGNPANLHYEFIQDILKNHSSIPNIPSHISTLIMHGTRDEVIPVQLSDSFASMNEHISFSSIEDGDHALTDSIPTLLFNTLKFLGNMDHMPQVKDVASL